MVERRSTVNPLFLRQEELHQGIELLFFAFRDFTATPDQILSEYGMGRAHHRAIYFIGRHPGITVGALLGILKITKQSLSRVLNALVQEDLVAQSPGDKDRRQRVLRLTEAGVALEDKLSRPQRESLAQAYREAYREAGAEAVEGFREVLLGLIRKQDQNRLRAMMAGNDTPSEP